jgi:gluconolactonase
MSAKFEVIAGNLGFPEGPIAMPDGSVFIVEIAAGLVSRVTEAGNKTVVARPGGSPNGAAIGPDGHLYVCNSGGFSWEDRGGLLFPTVQAPEYTGGRIERIGIESGIVEVLYDSCDGG